MSPAANTTSIVPNRKPPSRRTRSQAEADRRSEELAVKLGRMLREDRTRLRMKQREAAARAGIAASTWSQLEVARDARVTLATTGTRAASAVDSSLEAYLQQTSAATQPRDAVHLRHQELVIRTATAGRWQALPEEPIDRDAGSSRSADVLLRRTGNHRTTEYALVEVWDWFDDVGAALRAWPRRLDAVERLSIKRMVGEQTVPQVGGCWVLRSTQRNRQLLSDHGHIFRARFRGSGRAWLAALTDDTHLMPTSPALLWVSVAGTRIFPARLR